MSKFMIIQHDCEQDDHDHKVFGPFDSGEEASDFISKFDLEIPNNGGYAFATVVPADDREMLDPAEWAAMCDPDDDFTIGESMDRDDEDDLPSDVILESVARALRRDAGALDALIRVVPEASAG